MVPVRTRKNNGIVEDIQTHGTKEIIFWKLRSLSTSLLDLNSKALQSIIVTALRQVKEVTYLCLSNDVCKSQ